MAIRLDHPVFGSRLALASLGCFSALLLLILRLWFLQGVQGGYYRDLSENNRTRTVRVAAPRGTVYDREGRVLIGNRPSFQVAVIPEDTPDIRKSIADVAEITGRNPEQLTKQLASQRGRHHFEPKLILADISREELAKLKVNSFRLAGILIDVVPTRFFPYGDLAAQLFGYTREITREQLDATREGQYRPGDIVGQSGIEKRWEEFLRGQSGYRQVEVDAMGKRKGELGIVDVIPGQDVFLTLDLDLQREAHEALRGKRGAVIVLDPKTGEVLALASAPSFDLNSFSGQMDPQVWQDLATDRSEPLNDRPISQVYPIGSTFKVVTSFAGLAEKKISINTTWNCPGYYFFAGRQWKCHKHSGHGSVSLPRALAVSCNAFYFQLGQLLGIELIEKYAKLLGLGERTGIDLPGEAQGIVPSDSWKRKTHDERWYPGDTLPVSIGQGYLVATPIQMAVMVTAVANNGTVYRPQLLKRVLNRLTNESKEYRAEIVRHVDVPPEIFAEVRQLMAGVVNDANGTGKSAKLETITVAGKTGTAQVRALGKAGAQDHAWFVAMAPMEDPQITMAVLVEHGGHGGTTAAPIAKRLFEIYFRKKGMLPPKEVEGAKPADSKPGDQKPAEPKPEEHVVED